MNELLMMIDAWFDTEQGIFWMTVLAFVALAAIPMSILVWAILSGLVQRRRWAELSLKEQVARELRGHDTPVNF